MQKIKIPLAVLAFSNAFWAWIEKRPIENILFSAFLGVLLIVWYFVIRKIEQKAALNSEQEDHSSSQTEVCECSVDKCSDFASTSSSAAELDNADLSFSDKNSNDQ